MRKLLSFISAVSLLLSISCAAAKPTEKQMKATEKEIEVINNTSTTVTVETQAVTTIATETITDAVPDKSVEKEWHYRGLIIDCNSKIVVFNDDTLRKFSEEYAYSCSNVIDSYNSKFTIDNAYEDLLRTPNPTPIRSSDGHFMDQSVQLTLNADMQTEIYNYLKENNIIGSVTIVDATGAIKSLVSYPSYDANAEFDKIIKEDHACLNRCLEAAIPGSLMKMLTSVLASMYGFDNCEDKGYLATVDVANWDVKNDKPYATPIIRTNREALRFSSNCFYSEFTLDIGADKFRKGLNDLFKYDTPIDCGFVTIENTIDLSSNGNLARASFGQREKISPLYLCMISNAIISGEMNIPFVLDKTIDTKTMDVIKTVSSVDTISTIPEEYTADTKNGMLDVASDLNLVVDRYIVYAKTGTAQICDDGSQKDIHYVLSTISDNESSVKNSTTVLLQYLNSPAPYASGDSVHMQNILDIAYREGGVS